MFGDSFAPPYFIAGVGAGDPLPSDDWWVTPLSASACPAAFACVKDSAEMDATGEGTVLVDLTARSRGTPATSWSDSILCG